MRLAVEAFVVGIVMLIIFAIIAMIVPGTYTAVFLTGIVGHFLFEAMGANAYYCKHGVACQKA